MNPQDVPLEAEFGVTYEDWIGDRKVATWGSNHGSDALPFQRWHKFKEAFAPELVELAVRSSSRKVTSLVDPFGGSGTSALTAQFLDVVPLTAEVNPYLQDVIQAKLCTYDADRLRASIAAVMNGISTSPRHETWVPTSFVEPGAGGRWIFSKELWDWICRIRTQIELLANADDARLIRVVLGGLLVRISNVRVSGKGRRYRGGWSTREVSPSDAHVRLGQALAQALDDIQRFGARAELDYLLVRGDARDALDGFEKSDLAVFSPPYPNSFDYTDIYNVELWALGYLTDMSQNRALRLSTLSSHVQIHRDFPPPPIGSGTLDRVMEELDDVRKGLWNRWIPDMVGAYFAEMIDLVVSVGSILRDGAQIWMVVGDSRYGDVDIPVADILNELSIGRGLRHLSVAEARAMRRSPQQGGAPTLAESVLVLEV